MSLNFCGRFPRCALADTALHCVGCGRENRTLVAAAYETTPPTSRLPASIWSSVWVSIPSTQSESLVTSPEVERNKVFGARGDVSNARPIAYKAIALPTELQGQNPFRLYLCASGRHEAAPGAFAASQAVFQPPTGTSHASFPRLRDVVLQRHTRNGADSRPRTDDIEFGKLTLYPLSYVRKIVRLFTIQSLAWPHGKLLKIPCA